MVTLKGLHPGVNQLVRSQVFSAAEGFLAFVILKVLPTDPWMLSMLGFLI